MDVEQEDILGIHQSLMELQLLQYFHLHQLDQLVTAHPLHQLITVKVQDVADLLDADLTVVDAEEESEDPD